MGDILGCKHFKYFWVLEIPDFFLIFFFLGGGGAGGVVKAPAYVWRKN